MDEEVMFQSPLRTPCDFSATERQITRAVNLHGLTQRLKRLRKTREDEPLGKIDSVEPRVGISSQDHGEIPGPRPDDHGPATAGPPRDRNVILAASLDQDIFMETPRCTQHDGVSREFPDTDQRGQAAPLDLVEQRLVEGEILLDRGKGLIKKPQERGFRGSVERRAVPRIAGWTRAVVNRPLEEQTRHALLNHGEGIIPRDGTGRGTWCRCRRRWHRPS
ncbi:MAG: hypothetical protein JWN86_1250 [Planctomycetota bacterium]|nr:hypothetical protein [Planctomycetota bacterium]